MNDVITYLKSIESAYIHLNDKWKSVAFGKAAQALGNTTINITKDTPIAIIMQIPLIGKSIAQVIKDFLNSTKGPKILELESKLGVPVDLLGKLLDLTKVPKIGTKTARKLYQDYGIITLDDLRKALEAGKLDGALAENVREGLKFVESQSGRMPHSFASRIASAIETHLRPVCSKIELAGSLRRKEPTIKDFDFVVVSSAELIKQVLDGVQITEGIKTRLLQGSDKKLMFEIDINLPQCHELRHMDVTLTTEESFGNNVNYLTGSRNFNIALRALALQKGYTVNEHFTTRLSDNQQMKSSDERDLYDILGISFVPPECRITGNEINDSRYTEASLIPADRRVLRGDFHIHSDKSDGIHSIEHLIKLAKQCKFSFVGISDHSISSHGVPEGEQLIYAERVHKAGKAEGIEAFAGAEVDIDVKGKLDYSLEAITLLDYVIISTHRENSKNVPERLKSAIQQIRAISDMLIIVAHPTGRIIGKREGYQGEDWSEFFKYCVENNVVLEINSLSDRKDLPSELIRKAVKAGCKFAIGSDTHGVYRELNEQLITGIWEARRGGLSKNDIINADVRTVKDFLKE